MSKRTSYLVNQKYSEYLVPTIMTSAALSMTSVIDGIIVGNLLGKSALAAIGLASPFIYGNNVLFVLFAVGGIICGSKARGERDEEQANRVFSSCLYIGTAAMVLYALAVTLLAQPVCTALAHGNAGLARDATVYTTSMIWASPFLIFALVSANFWKIDGNPKGATIISLIANAVKLVSDLILIRFLNMGLQGAGLANTLGYIVGTLCTLWYYRWPKRSFRFLKPSSWLLSCGIKLCQTGMYRAITSLAGLVQNLVMNSLITMAFGLDGLAVLTVCINTLKIALIFVNGASEALQPILAMLYGEKDIYGIRAVFRRALIITLSLCFSLAVLFAIFPASVGKLFGLTGSLSLLCSALRLYSIYIPFFATSQLLQTMYNSTGHNTRSILMSVFEGLVLVNGYALMLFEVKQSLLFLCYALAGASMLLLTIGWAALTRRQAPELNGLMLLPAHKTWIPWETSFLASREHAVSLSEDIIDFCEENATPKLLANRMAVSVEEMAVNTADVNAGHANATIDVLVSLSEDEILLMMRDNGVLFNPLVYRKDDELIHEGIDLVLKMATSVNYSHQLGFNIVSLGFARPTVAG